MKFRYDFQKWQTNYPMASHPVAYYGPTGSVVSAIDTYYVKTLCVQEIISGEYVLLVFFLV